MKVVAIIPAAGRGKRMGTAISKQYLPLDNKPVLVHTLMAFEESRQIDSIVLIVSKGDERYCRREIVGRFGFKKVVSILPGGKERQDSVRTGLEALDFRWNLVVIHDGVRPFVAPWMITESVKIAASFGACVVAVPVKDTVKEVSADGLIEKTINRKDLWMIQTPQVFKLDILKRAHAKALAEGFLSTDDSTLVERLGCPVALVQGSYENIKITTQEDLRIAEAILKSLKIDN